MEVIINSMFKNYITDTTVQLFSSIFGNNKQQIVQVGNAVPPPLIEKIVKNIIGGGN